jgi:hypothetical protein
VGLWSREGEGEGRRGGLEGINHVAVKQTAGQEAVLMGEVHFMELFQTPNSPYIICLFKTCRQENGLGSQGSMDPKGGRVRRMVLEYCDWGDFFGFCVEGICGHLGGESGGGGEGLVCLVRREI